MIYADYTYYRTAYLGNVPEDEFPRLAVRASSYMDYITQNRAKNYADLDAVKMCCCALVDKYRVIEAANEAAVRGIERSADAAETKSETVGGWSRTVATGGEAAAAALSVSDGGNKLLADTCREYLAHTGLLYRGGNRKCMLPTL